MSEKKHEGYEQREQEEEGEEDTVDEIQEVSIGEADAAALDQIMGADDQPVSVRIEYDQNQDRSRVNQKVEPGGQDHLDRNRK